MNHGSIVAAFAPFRRSRTSPPALDETKLSPPSGGSSRTTWRGTTWTRWFRGRSEAAIRTASSTFRRRGEHGQAIGRARAVAATTLLAFVTPSRMVDADREAELENGARVTVPKSASTRRHKVELKD